jgi:hypothetical protein
MADRTAQQVMAGVLRALTEVDPNRAPKAEVKGGDPPSHKAVFAEDGELKASSG